MSEQLKNGGRVLKIHIPEEIAQHRSDIKRLVDGMVYKLHRNRHKGRWEDIDLKTGMAKLRGEVAELREAIKNGNSMEIVAETADVAAWAMILCNIALDKKDV